MSTKKKTIEDCKNLAESKGGKCLSEEYINSHTKYLWECARGHRWMSKQYLVQQGYWCLECSGSKKKTIEDCKKFAELKNGICLSSEYKNNKQKIKWQCSSGHQWEATFSDIKNNDSWCPECCGHEHKTIEHCCALSKLKNGKCLSTEYKNSKTKLLWECEKGHQWQATYSKINQGQWCRECSGYKKKDIDFFKDLAKKNNGQCLSDKYINSISPLLWRCEKKHEWSSLPHRITQGSWCSVCINKNQEKLYSILQDIFHNKEIEYNYRGFSWLKNKKKMELDFYIPNLKLAIEYNGEQHYRPVDFFGGEEKFHYTQKLDILKQKLIQQNKQDVEIFIVIDYKIKLTKENVIKILGEHNLCPLAAIAT